MKVNITKKEVITIATIGAIIVLVLPWIFVQPSFFPSFMGKGEIGDTIGGITAPFLSFFGSVLVYLALKSQIDANEEFKKQFKRQNYDQLFFRLMDKLNEKVLNFHITDGAFERKGYESLSFIVNGLKSRVKEGIPSVLKESLMECPEEVSLQTYKSVLEILQPYNSITDSQAEELKNRFVKAMNKYDRKMLINQYVVGSFRSEKVKDEAMEVLYSRPSNMRRKVYDDVFERLYNRCGAFMDAYIRNLVYLIELIDQEEENEFYTDYLKGNLSDHEKALLYYYLFGKQADQRVRQFFQKSDILKDFDFSRYTNVPNETLFRKELHMLFS